MVEVSQHVIHVRRKVFAIHAQLVIMQKHHHHHCRALITHVWLVAKSKEFSMLYVISSDEIDSTHRCLEQYHLLPRGIQHLASTWSSKPLALIVFFLNTGLASNEGSVSITLEAALEGFYNTAPREAHPVCILTVLK